MASLSPAEKQLLEELFEMKRGYVLDFSDRTLHQFFKELVGIDIYAEKYATQGNSKANRVRTFWQIEDDKKVSVVLDEHLTIVKLKGVPGNDKKYEHARRLVDRLSKAEIRMPPSYHRSGHLKIFVSHRDNIKAEAKALANHLEIFGKC